MPGKYQNQIKVIDTIHELDLDFLGQSHSIYIKDSNLLAAFQYLLVSFLAGLGAEIKCMYCACCCAQADIN